jgi:hypothetical protein
MDPPLVAFKRNGPLFCVERQVILKERFQQKIKRAANALLYAQRLRSDHPSTPSCRKVCGWLSSVGSMARRLCRHGFLCHLMAVFCEGAPLMLSDSCLLAAVFRSRGDALTRWTYLPQALKQKLARSLTADQRRLLSERLEALAEPTRLLYQAGNLRAYMWYQRAAAGAPPRLL